MSYYTGIPGIYFRKILTTIIKIGNLKNRKVLDFGCGEGQLKKILPHVINYDKDQSLSDITDWRNYDFDVLVANEVFYEMTPDALQDFLQELRKLRPDVDLIVGISRQSALNKLGAQLLNKNAYNKAVLPPNDELKILNQYCEIIDTKIVWSLCDIYKLRFK